MEDSIPCAFSFTSITQITSAEGSDVPLPPQHVHEAYGDMPESSASAGGEITGTSSLS